MKKRFDQLVLTKEDYRTIMECIHTGSGNKNFNRQDAEELKMELKKAMLVDPENLQPDVIRLNSEVVIRYEKQKTMQLMVVTPDKADIKHSKISIMSPIGTALIGVRKGQEVKWKVPGGKKTFSILEVRNS